MQASVTDYFKSKKRGREPDNVFGKSNKLLAASSSTESGQDVPVPVERVKEVKQGPALESSKPNEGQVVKNSKPKEVKKSAAVVEKPKDAVNLKKLLKNKGKLADLQAALAGINGCSDKLAEFRRNAAKRNAETITPATTTISSSGPDTVASEKSCLTPDKFYSPRKVTNIFNSPTKLHQIESPSKVIPIPGSQQIKRRLFETGGNNSTAKKSLPAYQRFHNLAQKNEIAATPDSPLICSSLPLPFKFKVLEEFFNAFETVASILHNRKELITFMKIKAGVLELVRRGSLRQSHLGQILTVFPECYSMSQEKVKLQGVYSYQLVITVNLQPDENMSATTMTSRKKIFRQNLVNICHQYHKKFLETLQPPIVIPDDKSVTRWHPRFLLDDVPDIIGVPIPVSPVTANKVSTAKDVINKAQHILENANPRMKKAVQDMLNRKSMEEKKLDPAPKSQKESEKNKKTLKALKGISQSLIEKIRAREQEKSIRSLTLTPEQTKRKSMLSRLPEFVKIIRNTFVAEKKAALHIQVAIERISHSGHGTMTQGEVEEHIRLLGTVVPEWLKILSLSQGVFIKIEQQLDINELITQIQDVARRSD